MRPAARIVVGLLVVALLVFVTTRLLGGDDDDTTTVAAEGPVALSETGLRERVSELGLPVYWVGPRPGTEAYELTVSADGSVTVRYLIDGAEVGAPAGDLLAVATYPLPDAAASLQEASADDATRTLTRAEGFQVLGASAAGNAYAVFDDQPDLQVEVYSPTPGEATELAGSGALAPLG